MLDEFKFFYRNSVLYKRLLICALAGMLVPLYVYFDGVDETEAQYDAAVTAEGAANKALEDAKIRSSKLPTLMAELETTREQLKLVESELPDSVKIDEVLRTVGKTVKPAAIQVLLFKPEAQIIRGDVYKYVEVPVKISVEAREYSQICEWLDSVAGESKPMYLKAWTIMPLPSPASKSGNQPIEDGRVPPKPLDLEALQAQSSRENLRLRFDGSFSMFKLATEADVAQDLNKSPVKDVVSPDKALKGSGEPVKAAPTSAAKLSQPIEKSRQ